MGRPSPQAKQLQRKRQKERRKLFPQTSSPHACDDCEMSRVTISDEARCEDAAIGEDMDTLTMNIEDCVKRLSCDDAEYSVHYLLDCRKTLMAKVDRYRKNLEQAYTENAEQIYKHRKDLEQICSFYQAICHLPTRAGRILKASQGKTSAARQVLEEAGLNYVFDGEKYIC